MTLKLSKTYKIGLFNIKLYKCVNAETRWCSCNWWWAEENRDKSWKSIRIALVILPIISIIITTPILIVIASMRCSIRCWIGCSWSRISSRWIAACRVTIASIFHFGFSATTWNKSCILLKNGSFFFKQSKTMPKLLI